MRTFTAIVYPGETGRWFVALNPETGTTTQGKTVEEALANLEEATALFIEQAQVSDARQIPSTGGCIAVVRHAGSASSRSASIDSA